MNATRFGCYVVTSPAPTPSGGRIQALRGLSWLLRHAGYVTAVTVRPVAPGSPAGQAGRAAVLVATGYMPHTYDDAGHRYYSVAPYVCYGGHRTATAGNGLLPADSAGRTYCPVPGCGCVATRQARFEFTAYFASLPVACQWVERRALKHAERKLYNQYSQLAHVLLPGTLYRTANRATLASMAARQQAGR